MLKQIVKITDAINWIKENVNKLNKLSKDKNKQNQYHQQKQMIKAPYLRKTNIIKDENNKK